MSLFGALSSAVNSLQLVQASLQNTSENINNVNDPNATTHTVTITSNGVGGAQISQYSRVVDQALQGQLFNATSENGMQQELSSYMTQLNSILGTTSSSTNTDSATPRLSTAMQNFTTAMQTLSGNPTDQVAQSQVIQAGQSLVDTIHSVSGQVDTLYTQAVGDINTSVTQVNSDLATIDKLNNTIQALQAQNQPTANLEDQRDATLKDLAGLVNIKVVQRDQGTVSVFTATGATLLDGAAQPISYDGAKKITGAGGTDITSALTGGKLGGLLSMVADNSPAAASNDPSTEVFRKLKSQLTAFTTALTGPTTTGQPTSLADAYNNATPVQPGEENTSFFVGSTPGTIEMNPNLASGKTVLKQSAISGMVTALSATGRTFSADGLQFNNTTYSGMADGIATNWSNVQNTVSTQATSTSGFLTSLQTRYSSETGVNLDTEVANLQVLQRNYQAAARIISTTNTMFSALEAIQ